MHLVRFSETEPGSTPQLGSMTPGHGGHLGERNPPSLEPLRLSWACVEVQGVLRVDFALSPGHHAVWAAHRVPMSASCDSVGCVATSSGGRKSPLPSSSPESPGRWAYNGNSEAGSTHKERARTDGACQSPSRFLALASTHGRLQFRLVCSSVSAPAACSSCRTPGAGGLVAVHRSPCAITVAIWLSAKALVPRLLLSEAPVQSVYSTPSPDLLGSKAHTSEHLITLAIDVPLSGCWPDGPSSKRRAVAASNPASTSMAERDVIGQPLAQPHSRLRVRQSGIWLTT